RYAIWIKPSGHLDGLCRVKLREDRREDIHGCWVTDCIARRRGVRERTWLCVRAIGTAPASRRGRARLAGPRLCLDSRLLPLRTRKLRLDRRTLRARPTVPRALGAGTLGKRPPRLV